jgi:hypothetical protein
MFRIEPIVSTGGRLIVHFLDEYCVQYKIDSFAKTEKRSLNGTEIQIESSMKHVFPIKTWGK